MIYFYCILISVNRAWTFVLWRQLNESIELFARKVMPNLADWMLT